MLRIVLTIYLSVAVVLTCGQLALEYANEKRRLTNEIHNAATTFLPIISKAVWDVDEEQITSTLAGVLGTNNDVLTAVILDEEGQPIRTLLSSSDKHDFAQNSVLLKPLRNFLQDHYVFKYDLIYENDLIGERMIGNLILMSDSTVVLRRASHTFLITIISAIFKTSLLATIFFIIMRRMVDAPLKYITYTMHHLDPKDHDGEQERNYNPKLLARKDELGVMARTFTEMARSLKQKDKAISTYANELEIKVQERTQQLEQASQAKSDFLASVSHEIRTPMNGIIGLAHLLSETELSQQQREYIEVIQNSGQSLISIINEILDHLKIESKKIELENTPFNLKNVFHESVALFSHRAREANIQVISEFGAKCPTHVYGDSTRIRQILLNLLGNAFKFTGDGAITIKVQSTRTEGSIHHLLFTVQDTGIGIDQTQRHRLFKPFSQADSSTTRRYGGTGLGLAISKQLVELMGGKIGVDSEPGKGSCFWFELPLKVSAEIAQPTDQPEQTLYENLMPLQVLVAEDNLVNQMVITAYLKKYNLDPVIVNNGKQAVECCLQQPNHFDVIFMDGEMPEMDGWQAARAIRDADIKRPNGNSIVIVAMTAHAMDIYAEKAVKHGMNYFLSKPLNPEELRDILIETHQPYRKSPTT